MHGHSTYAYQGASCQVKASPPSCFRRRWCHLDYYQGGWRQTSQIGVAIASFSVGSSATDLDGALSVACSPISFLRRHRGTGSDEPTATAFAGYCGRGEDLGIVVGGPLAQVCEAVWAPESPLGRPGTRRSNTASLTFQPIALDCC